METSFSFCWSTRSFRVFWFWWNFLICLLLFTFLQQKSLLDVSKKKSFWPFCHFTVRALFKKKGQKLGFSSRKTFPQKKSFWPFCHFTVCALFKEKGQKLGFSSRKTFPKVGTLHWIHVTLFLLLITIYLRLSFPPQQGKHRTWTLLPESQQVCFLDFTSLKTKVKCFRINGLRKKSYCREPILLLVVNEKQIVRDTFLNNFHLQQKVLCQKKWPILFSQ